MENELFAKVYKWMFTGLFITFIVAFVIGLMPDSISNSPIMLLSIIVELILVYVLSSRIYSMSPIMAKFMFFTYSALNGLTISTILLSYDLYSYIYVFLITSIIFAILSIIGKKLKIDLSKFSNLIFVTLIIIIIVSVINLFLNNSMLDIIVSSVVIVTFVGITIFDIQKLKNYSKNGLTIDQIAIIGALDLYLDYINIFLKLIRLFGKKSK